MNKSVSWKTKISYPKSATINEWENLALTKYYKYYMQIQFIDSLANFPSSEKKKKKKEKQLWRIVLEINWTKQQISMQILKITTGLLVSSTGTLNWILFSF